MALTDPVWCGYCQQTSMAMLSVEKGAHGSMWKLTCSRDAVNPQRNHTLVWMTDLAVAVEGLAPEQIYAALLRRAPQPPLTPEEAFWHASTNTPI